MQSDEKYEIVEFSQTEKENLLKNQKTGSLKVINKFYLEIQSLRKKYSLKL